jgi:hypothetical protein
MQPFFRNDDSGWRGEESELGKALAQDHVGFPQRPARFINDIGKRRALCAVYYENFAPKGEYFIFIPLSVRLDYYKKWMNTEEKPV